MYLNNVLIYSKTLKEYQKYIRQVLIALKKVKLTVNLKKSYFYVQELNYLKFRVTPRKLKM